MEAEGGEVLHDPGRERAVAVAGEEAERLGLVIARARRHTRRARGEALGPQRAALGLLPAPIGCNLPAWILPHLQPLGLVARPANEPVIVH